MAENDHDLKSSEETTKEEMKQEKTTSDAATESEDKKSTKKAPAKSPAKPSKTKEKARKKEESDDEDESDDEELLGTLDKPLVVEGKRERKSTEFLVNTFKTPQSTERKKVDIEQGKGEALGTMPRVNFQLARIVADELKPLHRLLYGRPGVNSEVKKNIRNFSGFNVEKESKEYKKKLEMVDRFTMDSLRRLCDILDVEKKGKKEEILDRVMDFLMKPKASGKSVPQPKKKTPSGKKSGTKRKRPKKEKKSKSKEDVDDNEAVDSGQEGEEEEEDEKEKEKEPPSKKAKTSESKKEKKGKKESKKPPKKDKKVVSIKISGGKKQKKSKDKVDSDSSDDEPLIKKTKKSPPTDAEIKDLVKKLLDGADLEKITMKSVCKQVYDIFPDFDLTDRKDFIKEAVKEIIT